MADWDDYRYAAAVARAGTVRGAAKSLGVHPSTVTRRVDHFERRLGVVLFARSVRGLVPTVAGEQVVAAVHRVGEQLQELERRLSRSSAEMAGDVRVSVSPAVAAWAFMPAIKDLLDDFPALFVHPLRHWTAAAVKSHAVDVAVVVSHQPPGDLIGRPAGSMFLAGWANADVAARWPEGCMWLPSRLQQEIAPDYVPGDVPAGSVLDTLELQLDAVRAGLGASLLPCYCVPRELQLTELPMARVRSEIWVLSHPDTRGVGRVQVLASRLADAVRDMDGRAPS